jgi:hypothetical protein
VLSKVSASNQMSKRLGNEGLSKACRNLSAIACQTCSHALGRKAPALCAEYISVTLKRSPKELMSWARDQIHPSGRR